MSTQRHSDGTNGARLEHGAFARREYSLLAPEGSTGDPTSAGPQESGDEPEDTMGTRDTDITETGKGERNRQHAPPAHSHP